MWVHTATDIVTAASYFLIPVLLWALLRDVRNRQVVLGAGLFALFVLACGINHVWEALAFTHTDYAVQAWLLKVPLALISVTAAVFGVAFWRQLHTLLDELLRDRGDFGAVFAHSGIGIAMLTIDRRFSRVNPSLCAMLGVEADWLVGRNIDDVTYQADAGGDLPLYADLVAGQHEDYQVEKRLVGSAGRWFWVRITVTLVTAASGAPNYAIAQIEDIDRERRLRDQNQARLAELEAVVAQKPSVHGIDDLLARWRAQEPHG